MKYKFSKRSLSNLEGVHPNLVAVVHAAMAKQVMDFSVIEGVRDEARQMELVAEGKSRTIKSKHLVQTDGYAHAVDLAPYPVDWNEVARNNVKEVYRFGILAGIILSEAEKLGFRIINGADWDGDGQTLDHTFFDAPHFQIVL